MPYAPMGLDDTFRFDKEHRGEELWHVIETDVQYVRWLVEEADMDFQMDNEPSSTTRST